jgi:hypothetical protein
VKGLGELSGLQRFRRQADRWRRVTYRGANALRRAVAGTAPWPETAATLVPAGASDWRFHDERWSHVRERWANRARLAEKLSVEADGPGQPVTAEVVFPEAGAVQVRCTPETHDEWAYVVLAPDLMPGADFVWRLRFRKLTAFRELQFGFRYQDFYNRYRYRLEAGRVHLDHVVNGRFRNSLSSARLDLVPGRWYELCIAVRGNRSRCYVDGRLVLDDFDPDRRFAGGSLAVIMWEDDGKTAIAADIEDMSVTGLAVQS